ncbi:MAG: QueT transporter family protein [bacterium]
MKDIVLMWRNPRLVVLTAVCAAVYVAAMLPFKWMVVIPGLAEFRPASVFPIVFSLLFGPAGAWGSAFGNLAGDMLGGMFGIGSVFGFAGNFAYGYIPYKLWEAFFPGRTVMEEVQSWEERTGGWKRPLRTGALVVSWALIGVFGFFLVGHLSGRLDLNQVFAWRWGGELLTDLAVLAIVGGPAVVVGTALLLFFSPGRLVFIILVSSLACAGIIAWGVELIGWVPFPVLGVWLFINNFTLSMLLAPPLLLLLYPRAERSLMLFTHLLEEKERKRPNRAVASAAAAAVFFLFIGGVTLSASGMGAWLMDTFGLSETGFLGDIIAEGREHYFFKGACLFPLILLLLFLLLVL